MRAAPSRARSSIGNDKRRRLAVGAARPNASAPSWRNGAEKSRALIQQPQRCLGGVACDIDRRGSFVHKWWPRGGAKHAACSHVIQQRSLHGDLLVEKMPQSTMKTASQN